jgi:hypothetical protein
MALIYGIWWTSEKVSLSYLAGRVFRRARNSITFQGWTGPLGPRSRRMDCMIANVVVLV